LGLFNKGAVLSNFAVLPRQILWWFCLITKRVHTNMFYKRPFNGPNVVLYSYYAVKTHLPKKQIKSVLEVGCGLGSFTFRYLASHEVENYLAVDVSQALIDYLNGVYLKYYPNLKLISRDFCGQVELGKFDMIYSSDVLEHVYSVEKFVKNIFNSLNNNGTAILNFPNKLDHGINHFDNAEQLNDLFADFASVQIYKVTISQSFSERIYFYLRSVYDKITRSKHAKIRESCYVSEKQGVDCFEESSAFQFAKETTGIKNDIACALSELLLLVKPKIDSEIITQGQNIRDLPRIVIIASKES
jgi:2-polyprenyl-3-methyl-5-hydroxy-6-metoxy-1,4-benzoquinol methylase